MARDFIEPSVMPVSNWNMEEGYSELTEVDDGKESYPYRVYGTGSPSSLTVTLRVFKPDIDYMCGGALQGFQIKFHKPNEDPQVWKKYFQLSPETTKLFVITPNVNRPMANIKPYSPDIRECFFKSERSLRFFKHYTERNCESECLANYTLLQCGCVKFSMSSKIIYPHLINQRQLNETHLI